MCLYHYYWHQQAKTKECHKSVYLIHEDILYSAKLSREKTLMNFCSFGATREGFLHEIWVCPYQPMIGFSILRKFSPRNGQIWESFFPLKVSHYKVHYSSSRRDTYYHRSGYFRR